MRQPLLTVSVLDDDASVLKALTRLLRSAGWGVVGFEDPLAFLDHAATHSLPVAVMDMCLPGMNGLDVQTRLSSLSPATEVIFLTSRDDSFARERALKSGAFAFLLKSADDEQLLSAIKSAAARNGCARDVPPTSIPGEARAKPA